MEHHERAMDVIAVYFRFLRFSLGLYEGREFLSGEALKSFDWESFFRFSQEQTLTGIMFDGVQRLSKGFAPEQALLFRWIGQSQALRKQNWTLNRATAYIYNKVTAEGYRCCILKGQGNAVMYPDPHSRMPGDVDVWVDASREDLRKLAAMLVELGGTMGPESLNHIELTLSGVPVELHSTPAIMHNPIHNRRLQAWLRDNVDRQCTHHVTLPDAAGEVAVPTNAFNVVYQLFHLYHHYFFEGVGLRQVVDYYYVVSNVDRSSFPALQRDLKHLGLSHFAGAMMYVLHEVLGLAPEKMFVSIDVRRGQLLLDEILTGGNFGKYAKTSFGVGFWGHNLQRISRDLRLLRNYPAEALSEPIFRVWHFFWRMKNTK